MLAPGSTGVEGGFESCMRLIFFQDEFGKIANCKTYMKNVILALSRNTPNIDSQFFFFNETMIQDG